MEWVEGCEQYSPSSCSILCLTFLTCFQTICRETANHNPGFHQSTETFGQQRRVRKYRLQFASRHEPDFRDQVSRARRIRTGTAPSTSPPADHGDAKVQRHPLPSRYVKMGLHREPVIGGLHPVRFADSLNLGRHPALLLEGEQMLDHRVAERH